MSRTLTISAASGRIYPKKPDTSDDGLELIIDFSSGSSTTACTSVFSNNQGEIYTSDTRGNITQFLLKQNRYSQHIRNVCSCSHIFQVSSENLLLIKTKDILLYSLTGKKIKEFKQHYSSIINIDFNQYNQLFLTVSGEVAIIWDVNTWKIIRNLRSKGVYYSQVLFTPDGNSLITCFDDGKLYQWGINDNKLEKQFAFSNISNFCISDNGEEVFGAGKNGKVYVWQINDANKIDYIIDNIPGTSSLLQIKCFENEIIVLGNNGRLYIINRNLWRVEVEIQLGMIPIKSFSLAIPYLQLITNNGLLYIYDYKTLIEFNSMKNLNKINKGLEEELVFTYLNKIQTDNREVFDDTESLPSLFSKEEVLFTKLKNEPAPASTNISLSTELNCQHELFKTLFSSAKLSPHDTKINHCTLKRYYIV